MPGTPKTGKNDICYLNIYIGEKFKILKSKTGKVNKTFKHKSNLCYESTNLEDPIHHLLQSYLCHHQFHLEVEGRARKRKVLSGKVIALGENFVNLPETHRRSNFQTSFHNAGHRKETM